MKWQLSLLTVSLLIAAFTVQACTKSAGEEATATAGERTLVAELEERRQADEASGGTAPAITNPLAVYQADCPRGSAPSLHCHWLRGLVVMTVVDGLQRLELSRDQRGVEVAMAALEVRDEPEVLIAAGRLMGEFVETPGLAEKVTPLLESRYLEVQRIASDLLARVPNSVLNSVAYKWSEHHGDAPELGPYDALELPAHYAGMGFPEYPGAERFGLGDSDRSIGWSSRDPASTVAGRLGQAIGAEVLTAAQWSERVSQQMASASQAMLASGKMEEIQKLMEQYVKTQDEALLQKVERLQQEMTASFEEAAPEKGVGYVATPSYSAAADQIFYVVAEERAGHVARLILVYRQPVVERTVIQMAWDLKDYPSAWPALAG